MRVRFALICKLKLEFSTLRNASFYVPCALCNLYARKMFVKLLNLLLAAFTAAAGAGAAGVGGASFVFRLLLIKNKSFLICFMA